jgi:hypothetical protein
MESLRYTEIRRQLKANLFKDFNASPLIFQWAFFVGGTGRINLSTHPCCQVPGLLKG